MKRTRRNGDAVGVIERLSREISLNREFVDEKEVAFLSMVWTWLRVEQSGRRFFGAFGITDAQFNTLMILWDYRKQGLRQNELARLLVVNQASMGGVIDRMEKRGLLRRAADPADRRAYLVHLTKRGLEKLREVRGPYYRLLGQAFSGIEREALLAFIDFNDVFRGRLATLAGLSDKRVKGG